MNVSRSGLKVFLFQFLALSLIPEFLGRFGGSKLVTNSCWSSSH